MKDRPYNCPNCGAPIGYGPKCQYCGTVLQWVPYTLHLVVEKPEIQKLKARIFLDDEWLNRGRLIESQIKRKIHWMMEPKIIECTEYLVRTLPNGDIVAEGCLRVELPEKKGDADER